MKLKKLLSKILGENPEADVCAIVMHKDGCTRTVCEPMDYMWVEEDGSGIILYLKEFDSEK